MAKTSQKTTAETTHALVRMYRFGTGDCFLVKFYAGTTLQCKLMIDCGVWSRPGDELTPVIQRLIADVNGKIDVLVVTHEHKDHVSIFHTCRTAFKGLTVGQVWMGWTENDQDDVVKTWKKSYGQKRRALAKAAQMMTNHMLSQSEKDGLDQLRDGKRLIRSRQHFVNVYNGLVDLAMNPEELLAANADVEVDGYVGMLDGMKFVKENWCKPEQRPQYLEPGKVFAMPATKGVKVHVLGPPKEYDKVKRERGGPTGSYPHNLGLSDMDAYVEAVNAFGKPDAPMPFEDQYAIPLAEASDKLNNYYLGQENDWRRIDHEWLMSAGQLALRANDLTNNLSLALAIELPGGKVMLFPGDAEYGSWESWQGIIWEQNLKSPDGGPYVNDLLGRTTFYKIAHHLSHNGTAKDVGLERMPQSGMTAMATLDYEHISDGWKSTMPNAEIVKELLRRTSGRLIVTNTRGIIMKGSLNGNHLQQLIDDARNQMTADEAKDFKSRFKETADYFEFKVKA